MITKNPKGLTGSINITSLDAAMTLLFNAVAHLRGASEFYRYAAALNT